MPGPFSDALEIMAPREQTIPLVCASPHSGRSYPQEFLAASALDPLSLRRSEDSFVDELFGGAPSAGAPLLKALFPRAYLDPNREPYELDPTMFEDELPEHVNTRSPRVAAGLGTIARVVASGAEIYSTKLRYEDARRRIEALYWPYHHTLRGLIDQTVAAFGTCLLLDCHSMPSSGGPMDEDRGESRVDIVLGDCFGTSCAPDVSAAADRLLTSRGYRVVRNTPYAGGYTTRHYGRPAQSVHTLQIEINRRLYMDEAAHLRLGCFQKVVGDMTALVEAMAQLTLNRLIPRGIP